MPEMTPEQMRERIIELEEKLAQTQWKLGRYLTRESQREMIDAINSPPVDPKAFQDLLDDMKREIDPKQDPLDDE